MTTHHSTTQLGSIPSASSLLSERYQHYRAALTALGNATRFIELFLHMLRYVPGRGWFVFVETHWQPADMEIMLSLAQQSLTDFLNNNRHVADEDSALHERILKHVESSQSVPRLQALLRLARTFSDLVLPACALDADPYLLNLRNGTLNLRSGDLGPHNPGHYLTRVLPYNYDPKATAPIWEGFLERLTGSDPALQSYLQRAIGSTLFGESQESTCFVLTGPGQRAHQLLLSTLRRLLGSYSSHTLSLQQRSLSPTLLTSRLLTLSSSVFPKKVDPIVLSALLNHEPLSITKASTELVFEPHTTLWLSAPELPQLSDDFAPLREYLQPIPLSLVLSSHEAAQLSAKLQQALPAILNWAIEGFQLWYTADSPDEPACIQQASATFHEDQDPIALFLAQSCTPEPDQALSAHELYQAYLTWARASGERLLSASRFDKRALASGLHSINQGSERFYRHLKLLLPIASSAQIGESVEPIAAIESGSLGISR